MLFGQATILSHEDWIHMISFPLPKSNSRSRSEQPVCLRPGEARVAMPLMRAKTLTLCSGEVERAVALEVSVVMIGLHLSYFSWS